MIASWRIPESPLNGFIQSFYYYTGFTPEHEVDRFLPEGNVQLLLELTDLQQSIFDNETLQPIQTCSKAWFSGFRTQPITIPSGKNSEMIVCIFQKGKALPFINCPMDVLGNTVVDAEQVMGNQILVWREQIRNIQDPYEKLLFLEKCLMRFYQSKLSTNPFVDYMVQNLSEAPNQVRLAQMIQKVGYSHKHMVSLFKTHVGCTPKELLNILRFQKAIKQLELNKEVSWAQVADDCGFYDQSHFIANFKVFSGYTPTVYMNKKGNTLNYVPAD